MLEKIVRQGSAAGSAALCEANSFFEHPIKELVNRLNNQYRNVQNNNCGSDIRQAKILHYYIVTTFGNILKFSVDKVKDRGRVDASVLLVVR